MLRAMNATQLAHNMTNHPPKDDTVVAIFEGLRYQAKVFGTAILDNCPESRERALALTNLEQALMWAVAAVARNQGKL